MAKYLVEDTSLTAVADAIRTKGGTSEALSFPDGFVSALEGIQAGGGGDIDPNVVARGILDGTITEYSDSELTNILLYKFRGCTKLAKVNTPNVTAMGDHALSYTAIVEANFPNLASAGTRCFESCKSLVTASLPKVQILWGYNQTFSACASLKNVDLPSVKNLGTDNFVGCTSLEELILPSMDGDVGVTTFSGCISLKKVDFGVCCNFVRTLAFNNCTSLEAVIIRGNKVSTLSNVNNFQNSGVANGTGYIYVPSALVDSYKTATNWSTYATQFRAIEDYPEICGEVSA